MDNVELLGILIEQADRELYLWSEALSVTPWFMISARAHLKGQIKSLNSWRKFLMDLKRTLSK